MRLVREIEIRTNYSLGEESSCDSHCDGSGGLESDLEDGSISEASVLHSSENPGQNPADPIRPTGIAPQSNIDGVAKE